MWRSTRDTSSQSKGHVLFFGSNTFGRDSSRLNLSLFAALKLG